MCYLYMYTCIYIYIYVYPMALRIPITMFGSMNIRSRVVMFTAAPGFHPHGVICVPTFVLRRI